MNDLDIPDLTPAEEALWGRVVSDALKDEGAAFAPLPLTADLIWSHARGDQRRSRALGWVAAAVALLAIVSSLAWTWQNTVVPTGVPRGGALPHVVHLPADHEVVDLVAGPDGRRGGDDELAVGKASVAVQVARNVVMVVLAETGRHLFLQIPDATRTSGRDAAVALSPDGLQLAWSHTSSSGELAAVAVLDLRTGRVALHPSTGPAEEKAMPAQIVWSHDSRQIAWTGTTWNATAAQRDDAWIGSATAGAVSPRSRTTVSELDEDAYSTALAVADDGSVVTVGSTSSSRWRTDERAPLVRAQGTEHVEVGNGGAALTTDATEVVLRDDSTAADGGLRTPGTTVTLDLDSGRVTRQEWAKGFPSLPEDARIAGTTPRGATLLGAVREGGQVELRRRDADGDVVLLTTLETYEGRWTPSVASGLADVASVDFPAPPWASTTPTWVRPVLAVAAVLGLLLLGRAVLARRSDRARGPEPTPKTAPPLGFRLPSVTTVALVACTATLLWTALPLAPHTAVTAPGAGALPQVVHPFEGDDPRADDLEQSYGSGPLSVVAGTNDSTFLAVGANDGKHRFRPTPGDHPVFWTLGDPGNRQALTPDGTRLATVWADVTTPEASAGVALIDLDSGLVTKVPLTGSNGRPVVVSQLAWSPSGSHLAWFGNEVNSISADGVNLLGDVRTVGVMDTSTPADLHWRVEDGLRDSAIAVDDQGTGHLVIGRSMHSFATATPEKPFVTRRVSEARMAWSGAAVTPDGEFLDVGVGGGEQRSQSSTGIRRIDLQSDAAMQSPALPGITSAHVQVLGHAPDASPVVAVGEHDDGRQGTDIVVARPDGAEVLTRVPFVYMDGISVASDLAGRDSVDFGDPRWPVTGVRVAWTVALSALLAVLVVWFVRRHRAGRGSGQRSGQWPGQRVGQRVGALPQEPGDEVL